MRSQGFRAGPAGDHFRLCDIFDDLETCENASMLSTLRRPSSTMVGARYDMDPNQGQGYCELLRLADDLFVVVTNVTYADRTSIPVAGEDFIEFHFRLSGSIHLVDADYRTTDVSKGSLLIWRQPEGCDIVEHLATDGQREGSVTIYCRPSALERHFGAFSLALEEELAATLAPTCDRIRFARAALYPSLNKLVIELASSCDRSGVGLVRAEALVMQILSEVLSGIELQKCGDARDIRLSDRDIACLREAREMIVRTHSPAPTIESIGRSAGLSPTKLKSGFRLLFGQTISEFANDLRMSAAKDLLRKSDRPIAHVSAELGYEFQNSFTVAFRRKYGILPRDYRRDPLAYDQSRAMV